MIDQEEKHIKNGYADTWYQPNISWDQLFLQIYIHEARHSDPDDVGHVDCDGDGSFGEDQNLKLMGGYGVNVLFGHWLRYMLPEDITKEAIDKYGKGVFDNYVSVASLCTFDMNKLELNQSDQDWIESVSGYPIKCDSIGSCI